ncbi:MAG: hypothetical protein MPL62_16710, partial [Alphaproteobacteria bacterium]|nr:hypothetical protein [Alphaproteobacteria bacterium]
MKTPQLIDLSIDKIKVDQKNPRFKKISSQNSAIKMMLEDPDARLSVIAGHIHDHGLDPSKRLIVFRENGDYVCGDGNRRLTALKCLHNPRIVGKLSNDIFGKFANASFPKQV